MTVSVSFDTPQIQVTNSSTGIQLAQVILPYSIRNSENFGQYLGGQMTLGQSDGIKLTDNTKDWEQLGLAKIKNMVAEAEIYVTDPIIEVPEGLPASSAVEAPVSSAVEAPVASSVATVASSAEAPAPTPAPIKLASFKTDKTEINGKVGEETTVTTSNFLPANATDQTLKFFTENGGIATIEYDHGTTYTVKLLNPGTTKLHFNANDNGGAHAEVVVTVTAPVSSVAPVASSAAAPVASSVEAPVNSVAPATEA
ncbi:hypothetical protein [Weissella confusa]|uniref:hypothetical protein n=1 Tax=Weissella confusa TaxID=1583 RepID=UPI00107F68CA|nr:hypothetical protein [Weissella confusa]TGE80081.1 hypothetical protein C6P10_02645 [Weissella confusa]